jgi:hypothetical protein
MTASLRPEENPWRFWALSQSYKHFRKPLLKKVEGEATVEATTHLMLLAAE